MSHNYDGITPEVCERVLLNQAIVFVKAMVKVQQVCDEPEVIKILLDALSEVKEVDLNKLKVYLNNDAKTMNDIEH